MWIAGGLPFFPLGIKCIVMLEGWFLVFLAFSGLSSLHKDIRLGFCRFFFGFALCCGLFCFFFFL